jgi:hypothetical protein
MLSDRDCELLTAYVDGQLSTRQRKAALRLLKRSPEARQMLKELRGDSDALIRLPPRKLAPDFNVRLTRLIVERGIKPGGALPAARTIPTWLGMALAAAVLLAVGTASFLFFSSIRSSNGQGPPVIAQPSKPNSFFGHRRALSDLKQDEVKEQLARDLAKDTSFHLDLQCRDQTKTIERLKTAFSGKGIKLLVDKRAQESLKNNEPKASYVVYAENLEAEDLTAILEDLGAEAKSSTCASVLLNPMQSEHRTHLATLLGVDATKLQPPPKGLTLQFGIHDPDKKGKATKGRPEPKQPQRFALVMALDRAAHPQTQQIQQFLKSRREMQPGTLQVYLVVHADATV